MSKSVIMRIRPFSLLLFLPLQAFAQPPVLPSGSLPYIGFQHSWTLAANFIDVLDQGPDAIWDFSALAPNNTWICQWDTVTSDAQQYYPAASLHRSGPGNQWWRVSGDSLFYYGRTSLMNVEAYTDPKLDLLLPLNYGDSWTDVYEGGSVVSPSISGSYQAEVTGYGTLMLPSGTLPDVLRMDVVDVNVGLNTETYIDSITRFYRQGYSWCLLEVQKRQTIYDFGTYSSTLLYYMSGDITTGTSSGQATRGNLLAFPNPTKDWLHIRIVDGEVPSSMHVHDMAGRFVKTVANGSPVSGALSVDVRDLPPGLYTVMVGDGPNARRVLVMVE